MYIIEQTFSCQKIIVRSHGNDAQVPSVRPRVVAADRDPAPDVPEVPEPVLEPAAERRRDVTRRGTGASAGRAPADGGEPAEAKVEDGVPLDRGNGEDEAAP